LHKAYIFHPQLSPYPMSGDALATGPRQKKTPAGVFSGRLVMKHSKAAQWTDYQRPAEALRIAETAFAPSHLALGHREACTLTEVLFDSVLQPVGEGVRSKGDGARQILYRADPYQIDLQIEAGSGRNTLVIIGQVHDSREPTSSGRDVSVVISDLQGEVVLATTDRFGVFRKEVRDSGDLDLFFPTLTDKLLRIALRDPLRRLPKEKHLRVVRDSEARRKIGKKT
jgi:hypothetical protein